MDRGDSAEGIEGLRHPFQVFPEELWPEIIEKLQDSAEILKVIQAIPEIKDIMESRRRWWLFDKVIPQISHLLKKTDLLSLRLVCKLWTHGVDNFLENHPENSAYNPEEPVTGQIWIQDMKPGSSPPGNCLRPLHFHKQDKLKKFLQGMKGHPKEGCPIVGRAVCINSQEDMGILNGASEMFRKVGRHIWFLTLRDGRHDEPIPFSNSVREWIQLLPNLKSLKFQIPNLLSAEEEGPASHDPWMKPLPPLPQLETLLFHFENLPLAMVHALMSSYSLQIRRLWFPLRCWKPEYSCMLPNLTELTIEFIFSRPRLLHILLNIQAPLLYTLHLWFMQPIDVETDIFPWLKRFPLIRNLSIDGKPPMPGIEILINPEADSVPSLKFLAVPKSFLHANSDLLLCFPKLEFLDLGHSPVLEEEQPFEPTLKIWENIEDQTVYESNVWELMPRLKGITAIRYDPEDWNPRNIWFGREEYEYRKKPGAEANNPNSS